MATHAPKKILIVEDGVDIVRMDGSYSLRRNLYQYVNRPPAEFVKFALSRQGQKIVVGQGYYPLPRMELNRLGMMWATPVRTAAAEGTATIHNYVMLIGAPFGYI